MSEVIPGAQILIVEDSMGIARSLSLGLGLKEGDRYRATTCVSGEDALKNVLETNYDLIITDLRLPGIDGLTLLERIDELSPETRTILNTAYGSAEVEEKARRTADAYLAKPFTLQEMLGLVERVLNERNIHPKTRELIAKAFELGQNLGGIHFEEAAQGLARSEAEADIDVCCLGDVLPGGGDARVAQI